MITALDHIAIAVPDLEKSIKRFMEDFQLDFEGTEDVAAAKTSTAFFSRTGHGGFLRLKRTPPRCVLLAGASAGPSR